MINSNWDPNKQQFVQRPSQPGISNMFGFGNFNAPQQPPIYGMNPGQDHSVGNRVERTQGGMYSAPNFVDTMKSGGDVWKHIQEYYQQHPEQNLNLSMYQSQQPVGAVNGLSFGIQQQPVQQAQQPQQQSQQQYMAPMQAAGQPNINMPSSPGIQQSNPNIYQQGYNQNPYFSSMYPGMFYNNFMQSPYQQAPQGQQYQQTYQQPQQNQGMFNMGFGINPNFQPSNSSGNQF